VYVCVCLWLYYGRTGMPCEIGSTDQDAFCTCARGGPHNLDIDDGVHWHHLANTMD